MTTGADLVQAAPQDFLAHPGNWMQWISDYGGTATAGPNFSWVLATRALKRMEGLDLSQLTLALSGAEPVDPDAVEAFVAAAAPFGFRPGGVFPAFGMAEVAIGGSFPPPRPRPRVRHRRPRRARARPRRQAGRDRRSRRPRAHRPPPAAARARRCPGLEMRIVDPETLRGAARAPRRRAADPRHVGDARLLQASRRHRRAVPTTAGCAPATSATCSTASWCCAAASRT